VRAPRRPTGLGGACAYCEPCSLVVPPLQALPDFDGERDESGLPQGYGKVTFWAGEYVEGTFVHGQLDGRGVYCWDNGDR
jgi:hypothetical protein